MDWIPGRFFWQTTRWGFLSNLCLHYGKNRQLQIQRECLISWQVAQYSESIIANYSVVVQAVYNSRAMREDEFDFLAGMCFLHIYLSSH